MLLRGIGIVISLSIIDATNVPRIQTALSRIMPAMENSSTLHVSVVVGMDTLNPAVPVKRTRKISFLFDDRWRRLFFKKDDNNINNNRKYHDRR